MTALLPQIDASFYNLIHELVSADKQAVDGRKLPRRSFRVVQRVAPRTGPGIPREAEFFNVRCHDLTRQGFSFLMSARPAFTSLVAAFGIPPELIYVAAQVVHCTDVLVDEAGRVRSDEQRDQAPVAQRQDLRPMVLAGCRFTERLSPVAH